jgi:hypothetical protein
LTYLFIKLIIYFGEVVMLLAIMLPQVENITNQYLTYLFIKLIIYFGEVVMLLTIMLPRVVIPVHVFFG